MGRAMVQALNALLVQGAPESRQRRKVRAPIRLYIGGERKSAAGLARLDSALGSELQRVIDTAESSSARAAKSEEEAAQARVSAAAQKQRTEFLLAQLRAAQKQKNESFRAQQAARKHENESLVAQLAESSEESAQLTEQLSRLRSMRGMDAAGYKAVAEDLKGRTTRLHNDQRNRTKRSIREFARLDMHARTFLVTQT